MIRLTVRKALLCCSIALNALCAGGMFTFPLISSILGLHCKLSQPQLTTIVLAGIMSQYTIAAGVGWIIDRHGPSLCSLIAAVFFAFGFGGFAWEVYKTPNDLSEPLYGAFYRFTFFFLFVGLGTVFGYFSSLFAASKSFPNHIGLASGTSMALFGLSPFFFSVIGSNFFTNPNTGLLDVTHYTKFIALINFIVYAGGFVFLKEVPQTIDVVSVTEAQNDCITRAEDENTPLLFAVVNKSTNPTISELLAQLDFWLLGLFCMIVFGFCEMIISNIGTIFASLPPLEFSSGQKYPDSGVAFQVNLISAANTVTRISVGPIADFVSPIAAYLPSGAHIFPRKHKISRFAFLSGPALMLMLLSLWVVSAVQSQSQLWVLSLTTGLCYSSVFTILPSLISSLWGMQNMGRNFGLMMFAPFMGTPLFSYIYAFVSAKNAGEGERICVGRSCWRLTFCLNIAVSLIALMISCVLWKRWKGRI